MRAGTLALMKVTVAMWVAPKARACKHWARATIESGRGNEKRRRRSAPPARPRTGAVAAARAGAGAPWQPEDPRGTGRAHACEDKERCHQAARLTRAGQR